MTEEENEEDSDNWVLDLPLTKQGNSLAINVPRKVINTLGLGHGDKVRIILKKRR